MVNKKLFMFIIRKAYTNNKKTKLPLEFENSGNIHFLLTK